MGGSEVEMCGRKLVVDVVGLVEFVDVKLQVLQRTLNWGQAKCQPQNTDCSHNRSLIPPP